MTKDRWIKRRLDTEYEPLKYSIKENNMEMDNIPPMLKNLSLDRSMDKNIMDTEKLLLLLEDSGSEDFKNLKTEDNMPPFKVCPPRVRGTIHCLGAPCPREAQNKKVNKIQL